MNNAKNWMRTPFWLGSLCCIGPKFPLPSTASTSPLPFLSAVRLAVNYVRKSLPQCLKSYPASPLTSIQKGPWASSALAFLFPLSCQIHALDHIYAPLVYPTSPRSPHKSWRDVWPAFSPVFLPCQRSPGEPDPLSLWLFPLSIYHSRLFRSFFPSSEIRGPRCAHRPGPIGQRRLPPKLNGPKGEEFSLCLFALPPKVC